MEKQHIDNKRYPHKVRIVRKVYADMDNPFSDEESVDDVLYEGEGRSFTDTTTEGNGNVDESKRKASIPVRYDEWGADRKPVDGDIIEVDLCGNVEVGIIKDCEPDNNRSIVYWNYRRI